MLWRDAFIIELEMLNRSAHGHQAEVRNGNHHAAIELTNKKSIHPNSQQTRKRYLQTIWLATLKFFY